MELESSFMSFLLDHQQRHKRTLNFLILMEAILNAAKQIRHCYRTAELQRASDEVGSTNVQGEKVMKMDLAANEIILHYLRQSGQVIEATSEELDDQVLLNKDGRYFIYFDPLDGSSNIKHNLPVGFLFGIGKRNLDGKEDYHLRSGREFIAAGMFLLPSGQFTFALKNAGAWRFIMDQAGTYVRPTQIHLPTKKDSWELSWNAGNRYTFSDQVQEWISANERQFNFRYTGSLAVDFHRLLHNGGMFMYPAIVQESDPKKNRPEGKLRLMYECAVVACIAHEAGGLAIDEQGNEILDIAPEQRHQRSAIYVGNKEIVGDIKKVLQS